MCVKLCADLRLSFNRLLLIFLLSLGLHQHSYSRLLTTLHLHWHTVAHTNWLKTHKHTHSCRLCKLRKVPYGYSCTGSSTTQLAGRGSVFFCTLGEGEGLSPSPPSSPMGVGSMSHGTSSLSLHASSASDSEPEAEALMNNLVC